MDIPVNYVDIIIVATAALCFGLGLVTGLVWQLTGLVALAIGVLATILLGDRAAMAVGRWVENPQVASLIAYISIFALASMGVRVLAVVFSKLLEKCKLKKFDKILGGAVGLVKGFAICAVLIVILSQYGTAGTRTATNESLLGHYVVRAADWVTSKAEEHDVRDKVNRLGEDIRDLRRKIRENGDGGHTGTTSAGERADG